MIDQNGLLLLWGACGFVVGLCVGMTATALAVM